MESAGGHTHADLWPDRLDELADKVPEARREALEGAAASDDAVVVVDEAAEDEAARVVLTES